MRNRVKQVRPSALGAIEAWERTLGIRSRAGYVAAVVVVTAGALLFTALLAALLGLF